MVHRPYSIKPLNLLQHYPVGYGVQGDFADEAILHWNGSLWSVVPNPNGNNNYLLKVSALTTNDVWAAGFAWTYSGGNGTQGVLIEHWNGSQWSVSPSANISGDTSKLEGIVAIGPDDVWGSGRFKIGSGPYRIVVEHWDGNGWSAYIATSGENKMVGLDAISGHDVWAVGDYTDAGQTRTFIMRYSDTCPPPITPTSTPKGTPTVTPTTQPLLVAHVNWEARPPQPDQLQSLPITLTLKSGTTEVNYPTQLTDQYGFFTITLGNLPRGTYAWRADDSATSLHSPNYLASSGVLNLAAAPVTSVEIGLVKAGDASNDNTINIIDFNILKLAFGTGCGYPAYDNRADFTGDCLVNIYDFAPLKRNFGQGGAPPVGP